MEQTTAVSEFLNDSNFFYVIRIGMDSKYSYVSANYERSFDFLKNSLIGAHFSVTLHPEDVAVCADVGSQCFAQPGKLFPATLRKHDGKGGFVITQWEMKAVIDKSGAPAGIYCMGYNITEQMDDKVKLAEIGFIQSHLVRKPLANILGLIQVMNGMELGDNFSNINRMLQESSSELDAIIKTITNKVAEPLQVK